jgi:hypothetical protein
VNLVDQLRNAAAPQIINGDVADEMRYLLNLAANEIERQRAAMKTASDTMIGLRQAFIDASQMADVDHALGRILIWARGEIAKMPPEFKLQFEGRT